MATFPQVYPRLNPSPPSTPHSVSPSVASPLREQPTHTLSKPGNTRPPSPTPLPSRHPLRNEAPGGQGVLSAVVMSVSPARRIAPGPQWDPWRHLTEICRVNGVPPLGVILCPTLQTRSRVHQAHQHSADCSGGRGDSHGALSCSVTKSQMVTLTQEEPQGRGE